MSQGWQKHYSFGQAKCSAGFMHVYVEAADYPRKVLKNSFNGSRLCAKHALVKGKL